MMTCLAACTKQGSATDGEFKILSEYSFLDAMTIKLTKSHQENGCNIRSCDVSYMLNTLNAERAPDSHCFM